MTATAAATTYGSRRFLDFSPEIRDKIYRLLLCHPNTLGNEYPDRDLWKNDSEDGIMYSQRPFFQFLFFSVAFPHKLVFCMTFLIMALTITQMEKRNSG